MKYLTKAGKKLLEDQITKAYIELNNIQKIPPGTGAYRLHKRYIDGLEFLLDRENSDEFTN